MPNDEDVRQRGVKEWDDDQPQREPIPDPVKELVEPKSEPAPDPEPGPDPDAPPDLDDLAERAAEIEPEEKKRMEAELHQTRDRFKIANKFRWANIHDRFGHFLEDPESTGFIFRSGHQIVLMCGNHDHDFDNPLEAILALGALRRMMED